MAYTVSGRRTSTSTSNPWLVPNPDKRGSASPDGVEPLKMLLAGMQQGDTDSTAVDLLLELVVKREGADPDELPRACFDLLKLGFNDRPDLLPQVFDGCCARSEVPGSRDPAFCRMALLSAMLALMPGRPSLIRLGRALGPGSSLARSRVLQRALRLTTTVLRAVHARQGGDVASLPIPANGWIGLEHTGAGRWLIDPTRLRCHEQAVFEALAEARLCGEIGETELQRELEEVSGWERAYWRQTIVESDAIDLSRRLTAWCLASLERIEREL